MKRALKYLLIVTAIAVVIVVLVGYRLPEQHSASREREYTAAPGRIYREISTPSDYPRWRSGVQRVEVLAADSTGRARFREFGMSDATTYAIEQEIPDRMFVTRIADEGLPYGGTWTFELEPTQSGTRVRITEDGEVYNPFFRFMSRFVIGHHRGIDKYLEDLDKRLSSSPVL